MQSTTATSVNDKTSIHDVAYLCLVLIYALTILLQSQMRIDLIIAIMSVCWSICRRNVSIYVVLWLIIGMSISTSGVLVAMFIVHHTIDHTAIALAARIIAFGCCSAMLPATVRLRCIVLYLAQKHLISARIAYAIVAAIKAITSIGHELQRIRIAYLLRYGKMRWHIGMLLAILISASYQSLYVGINLYNKQLDQRKTFVIQQPDICYKDAIFVIGNVMWLIICQRYIR
jgi:energy-coupling factor transporter transmembrane protein EcfT